MLWNLKAKVYKAYITLPGIKCSMQASNTTICSWDNGTWLLFEYNTATLVQNVK